MVDKKKRQPIALNDEDLEKILDTTWENQASRRECEQKHVPDYILRQKKKKNL